MVFGVTAMEAFVENNREKLEPFGTEILEDVKRLVSDQGFCEEVDAERMLGKSFAEEFVSAYRTGTLWRI